MNSPRRSPNRTRLAVKIPLYLAMGAAAIGIWQSQTAKDVEKTLNKPPAKAPDHPEPKTDDYEIFDSEDDRIDVSALQPEVYGQKRIATRGELAEFLAEHYPLGEKAEVDAEATDISKAELAEEWFKQFEKGAENSDGLDYDALPKGIMTPELLRKRQELILLQLETMLLEIRVQKQQIQLQEKSLEGIIDGLKQDMGIEEEEPKHKPGLRQHHDQGLFTSTGLSA